MDILMEQVYILEAIIKDKDEDKIIVDVVGVYSNADDALRYKLLCEKDLSKEEKEVISFSIKNVYTNQPPAFLDSNKFWKSEDLQNTVSNKTTNLSLDIFDNTMIEMMKDGLVDQLIGPDGEFYYYLTEKGKNHGDTTSNEPDEPDDDDDWLKF